MPATSILLFLLPALATAHMSLSYPIPLNHPKNPFTIGGGDYDYHSPLAANGSNYPCKGYHKFVGTPAGSPVASWEAGSSQSFTVSGTAVHGGGSCQASMSEDGGQTFRVLRSFVGNCPVADSPFSFVVPRGARIGNAVFAWTWFNNLGNREMYMNCASIKITGGGGAGLGPSHPEIFKANIGNGCSSVPSRDLFFPDPGAFVSATSSNAVLPEGNCGVGVGGGGGGGGGSVGLPSVSSQISTGVVPTSIQTVYPPAVSPSVPTTTPGPSPSPPPSAPPAEATTSTASMAAPSGCMCICESGAGYTVNILPAPSVGAMLSNATAANGSVFVFPQAAVERTGTRTRISTMTRTRTTTRTTTTPTSTPTTTATATTTSTSTSRAQTADCETTATIPGRYRRE